MNVVPAILPHNFEDITTGLSRLEGLTHLVQIDLCDGVFGREKTWLPFGNEKLPSEFSYEFDIMLNDWRKYVPHCVNIGAKRIVAHADMFDGDDMKDLVEMIKEHSIALGISVSNDKNVDFHADMIRKAKELYSHVFIQVMGIKKIGEQGQFFDDNAVERIMALKQIFGDTDVQVDGGLKPETVKKVVEVGAETVVVGSFIFGHEDVGDALEELNRVVSN
jgi:ribulose-phosphate 3-epimerase